MKKSINTVKHLKILIKFQKRIKNLTFNKKFKTRIKVTLSTFARNNSYYFYISTIINHKHLSCHQVYTGTTKF